MGTDRFGNSFAPSLPYARGTILASTADDYRKLERAYALIRQRGAEHVFVFTGLEHALPMEPEDLKFADDELAPALWGDRLRTLALGHLGGSPERHDVVVTNRLTGATLATFLTLVKPGDTVIGVSASFSHPSVQRAAAHTGARFVDTAGLDQFTRALEGETRPTLVALTRLCLPGMLERRAGHIVNLGSVGSWVPTPYMATYSATKAFVLSFSEALAIELAGTGIQVLALCPGATKTEFQQVAGLSEKVPKFTYMTAQAVVRQAIAAAKSGKRTFVPGGINKMLVGFTRLAPRRIVARMAGSMFKPKGAPSRDG